MAVRDFRVDVGSLSLAVREYGGSGHSVLLVHGGPGLNLAIWDEFAPLLTDRSRVLAYDQRCNGLSDDGEECAFDVFVDDLHAVVAGLELDRPVIVGQSWGGWIALSYGARYDEAGAIIVADAPITYGMPEISESEWAEIEQSHRSNPIYRFVGDDKQAEALLTELAKSYGYDRFDLAVARRNIHRDEDGRIRYRWSADEYLRLDRRAFADAIAQLDPDAIYPRIPCPVLLVGATQGEQAQAGRPFSRGAVEAVQARYPQLGIAWLAAGHCLPLEAPTELAERVRGVVTDLERGDARWLSGAAVPDRR